MVVLKNDGAAPGLGKNVLVELDEAFRQRYKVTPGSGQGQP